MRELAAIVSRRVIAPIWRVLAVASSVCGQLVSRLSSVDEGSFAARRADAAEETPPRRVGKTSTSGWYVLEVGTRLARSAMPCATSAATSFSSAHHTNTPQSVGTMLRWVADLLHRC